MKDLGHCDSMFSIQNIRYQTLLQPGKLRVCRGDSRSLTFTGVAPGFVLFHSFMRTSRWNACKEYAPSLPGLRFCLGGDVHPTLKRGANNHCAYGADFSLA